VQLSSIFQCDSGVSLASLVKDPADEQTHVSDVLDVDRALVRLAAARNAERARVVELAFSWG
jgi:hypothetical protein